MTCWLYLGASKAVTDNPSIIGYAKLLQSCTILMKSTFFDHIDCGAFGKMTDEIKAHSASLKAAKRKLQQAITDMKVHTLTCWVKTTKYLSAPKLLLSLRGGAATL